MKAFVIVGIIIAGAIVLFIWYVRITKPDNRILNAVERQIYDMFV